MGLRNWSTKRFAMMMRKAARSMALPVEWEFRFMLERNDQMGSFLMRVLGRHAVALWNDDGTPSGEPYPPSIGWTVEITDQPRTVDGVLRRGRTEGAGSRDGDIVDGNGEGLGYKAPYVSLDHG